MKRLLGVVAVVAVIGEGVFALAFAHEAREPQAAHPGGMTGQMGGMMGSGGMMAGGPMRPVSGMMGSGHTAEQPLASLALQNKDHLGLTSDQVKALESLRSEFQKAAIRRSADLQVAEMELAELLGADLADLAKVEAKLRQIEGLRTELRLSRIKTLEKGKAVLTPEQRKKLGSLGPRASAEAPGSTMAGQGMEMQRFMNSDRMPQAMSAMMEMARQMGGGDTMAGMVRMMEMMSMMGQMMGGPMGGMMGPAQPQPSR